MTESTFSYLYGSIMLIIATICIVTGVRRFTRCTQTVKGKVCEVRESTDYGENHEKIYVRSPVIQYKVNGKTYKYKANYKSGILKHEKGDRVLVHYDPDNPKRVRIKGYNSYTALLTGGIFILLGVFVIVTEFLRTK